MHSRLSDITVISCNYNSESLTKCMIGSLLSNLPEFNPSNIYIIDNSDSNPITNIASPINVIDNSNYKYTPKYSFPSQSHSASISWAFKNIPTNRYVILCDNDILFKPNIMEFIELGLSCDCIGQVGYDTVPPNRLFPYLLMFDMHKYQTDAIDFFDINRCIVHVTKTNEPIASKFGNVYDTGYSFYMDIRNKGWNIIDTNISNYMIHLKSGSYSKKSWTNILNT